MQRLLKPVRQVVSHQAILSRRARERISSMIEIRITLLVKSLVLVKLSFLAFLNFLVTLFNKVVNLTVNHHHSLVNQHIREAEEHQNNPGLEPVIRMLELPSGAHKLEHRKEVENNEEGHDRHNLPKDRPESLLFARYHNLNIDNDHKSTEDEIAVQIQATNLTVLLLA